MRNRGAGLRMGMHAKRLVVYDGVGGVGTHNFDPRSENYNTEGAVIMGMIHFLLPYMILNVYVAIEGIDRNLISAARTLGRKASCERIGTEEWQCRPISRFCSRVALVNSSIFWKVRAMPSLAIWCAGTSVMSRPSKNSLPDVGL